jgi:beta-glucosidase
VRDVLRVKFMIGLFDHPYIESANAAKSIVNSAEHQQVALRAARESVVLLKNDKNILPLNKQIKSIAVIGPNADDQSLTNYRYGPSAVTSVTVRQGIQNLLGNGCQSELCKRL